MADTDNFAEKISASFTSILSRAGAYTVIVDTGRFSHTGVLWKKEAVITANHAVRREQELTVVLPDGTESAATLAGRDPVRDLAVLKLKGGSDRTASWQKEPPALGQIVFSLAKSREEGLQATIGIIGTVAGPMYVWPGAVIEQYIQTDGARYAGFSGGPLVNTKGEVAGINVFAGPGRVPLTIPAELAIRTATELLEHGSRKTAFLGINSQTVRLDDSASETESGSSDSGLLVTSVNQDSPAGKAGLKVGDIILKAGDIPVEDHGDLLRLLMEKMPGDNLDLQILKGGTPMRLNVILGERPIQFRHDRCDRP